ncbi:PilZ domain-containing protein [Desulfocurvibacter africanus]|uniref:Type IV pilus assembly PilZ n=1 Tax=Desulfocurvibacter africanus subsp. africanus str. Walvis Bay TaxID=690850 RepID=F3YUV4_DESAF|nr:PilZ domain-containing protein [Desulfocurvibacter africanus]EGJ49131.1 type IV pilus assembly PilZ [Desulfocurvibacter africanus subsp. africanus str. Walvis Bay]
MLERRSEVRFQLKLEAMVEEARGQDAMILRTRDVSSVGVYLHGQEQRTDGPTYCQGDLLLIQIYLPAFRPKDGRIMSVVRAEGRVVRLEAQGLAIRFRRESRIEPLDV